MSIDLAHPPPHTSHATALEISQVAPKFVKRWTKPAPWPLSLFSRDATPEIWASYETLYLECLRTGDDKSARQILDKLVERFGDKNERVMAYQGMWEEATARTEKDLVRALQTYEEILQKNPANMVCFVPLIIGTHDLLTRNSLFTSDV
jgi:hypothetical protein